MCNVKEGKTVSTKEDLQNVVISEILRQTSIFSMQELIIKVNDRLMGSRYHDSVELRKKCEDTIDILYSINRLKITESGLFKLSISFPSITPK